MLKYLFVFLYSFNLLAATYEVRLNAFFEGRKTINFKIDYDDSQVRVFRKPEDRFLFREKATGKIHEMSVSFEGGRGYKPAQYWAELKPCKTCAKAKAPFSISGIQNLTSFKDAKSTWVLFNGPGPKGSDWLFVILIREPSKQAPKLFSSLKIN